VPTLDRFRGIVRIHESVLSQAFELGGDGGPEALAISVGGGI